MKHTLNIDYPEDEEIFACINLCNKNDKIDIINDAETASEQSIF